MPLLQQWLNSRMAYVKKQLPKDIKQSAVTCAINGSILLVIISTKNIQKSSVSEISWFCMPCLKKELPFNSISSQHFEKIFRDAPIVPLPLNKNQIFTENVNEFLLAQSKSLLNCQFYNISEFNNMIVNHKEKFS